MFLLDCCCCGAAVSSAVVVVGYLTAVVMQGCKKNNFVHEQSISSVVAYF